MISCPRSIAGRNRWLEHGTGYVQNPGSSRRHSCKHACHQVSEQSNAR